MMGHQQITITLPERVYQQVEKLSQAKHHSVAEEVVAVVAAALPEEGAQLPADQVAELSDLEQLRDADLWRAAKMTAPGEKIDRMQLLVEKQQLEGLTAAEKEEAELLSHFFNRIMLVRAKATVLLQARGHDISLLPNN
jgi:chorismate mutase